MNHERQGAEARSKRRAGELAILCCLEAGRVEPGDDFGALGRARKERKELGGEGGGDVGAVEDPLLEAQTRPAVGDDGDGGVEAAGIAKGAGIGAVGFGLCGSFEGGIEDLRDEVGQSVDIGTRCWSRGEDVEADIIIRHEYELCRIQAHSSTLGV